MNRFEGTSSHAGRVAIIDYREGELPVGPPPGHKLSRENAIGARREGHLDIDCVASQYGQGSAAGVPGRADGLGRGLDRTARLGGPAGSVTGGPGSGP